METPKKPIFILSPPDVFGEEREAASETVKTIIELGEMDVHIKIIDNWNEPFIWFEKNGKGIYIDSFYLDSQKPLIGNEPQYDLILTTKEIRSFNISFALGYGIKNKSCIVSLNELRKIGNESKKENYEKQLVFHEVGHMLGMPHRKEGNIDYEMGIHCTNACSMREVETVRSLDKFVRDSNFLGTPYCKPCIEGLKNYFRI